MKEDRIARARALAGQAHAKQKRRGGEAYVNHPIRVAELMRSVSDDEDLQVAALLHDTIEDSDITREMIAVQFGPEVARIVAALSDPAEIATLPREERKAKQAEKYATAPQEVQMIKMADQIDNLRSIRSGFDSLPVKFRNDYPEAAMQVVRACRPGSEVLFGLAQQVFEEISTMQAGADAPGL